MGEPSPDKIEGSDPRPPSSGERELAAGTMLGRYVLLRRLGQGAAGVVYLALDSELERRVAIKVLQWAPAALGESEGETRARLLREAQALAKVSHPNVISIFDVGTFGGEVFIAMEYARGQTLREWLKEDKPSARGILDAFLQAGRGLEAAHEAGLLHRDFKPDNAIVGDKRDKGVVKVLDFGLATLESSARSFKAPASPTGVSPLAETGAHPPVGLASPLTRSGTILGTPAYMAPELLVGKPATVQSDQFAFAVALYEALYGERPFEGNTLLALEASAREGRIRPPPKGARVPFYLRGVLVRALSGEPERRFASMRELLVALSRDPATRRRRWAGAIAICAVAVVALASGDALRKRRAEALHDASVRQCRALADPWAGTWDAPRKEALARAFAATSVLYAADTWQRVERTLNDYAASWSGAMQAACEATRVSHTEPEATFDLKSGCLEDRLEDLRALAEVLKAADAKTVKNAAKAAHALPPVARCADIDRLAAGARLPTDPQARAEIRALKDEVSFASALNWEDKRQQAKDRLEPLTARIEATGYGPLLVGLSMQMAQAEWTSDAKASVANFEQAVVRAESYRLDFEKARAELQLCFLYTWMIKSDEARNWADMMEGTIRRMGGDAHLESQLDVARGWIAVAVPQETDLFARALERMRAHAIDDPSLRIDALLGLGKTQANFGHIEEGIETDRLAIREADDFYGRAHRKPGITRGDLANVLLVAGRPAEALILARESLDILSAEGGALHGWAESFVGNALLWLHRPGEALPYLEGSCELIRAASGGESGDLAMALDFTAQAHLELGHLDLAEHALEESERIAISAPELVSDRALLHARIELAKGHPERAERSAEQALATRLKDPTPGDLATTRLTLAKILVAVRGDRARARTLAEQALAWFAAHDRANADEVYALFPDLR
jgi:serine/threonine protein kinase